MALAVTFMSLAGCAVHLGPTANSVAYPEARIDLTRGGEEILWQNSDLAMTYSFSKPGNNFTLSGKLVFDASVTNSFELIKHFRLKMSFLNSEGRVIESIDITPFYGFMTEIPDSMIVKISHLRPAGAEAIAFNYHGIFRGAGEEVGGAEWFISYYPYD